MDILVFTGKRALASSFKLSPGKKAACRFTVLGWKDFRKRVAEVGSPTLCYLDLSTLPKGRLPGFLRLIGKNEHAAYGLIDPGRAFDDAAEAFHRGAADYLDRAALRGGITAKRLQRVQGYVQSALARPLRRELWAAQKGRGARYIPSGTDWAGVTPEREYTFSLIFIELDGKEEMEKKYGMKNLSIALSSFRSYIENAVRPYNGRLWIWSSFGGIALFPFDGIECPALTCAFRLMLFKHLYDIEVSRFPNFLSLRLVLDIGNIVYTERNAGNVISDTLNSIFHLGQQFATPGNFYVTEEALRFGYPALKSFFTDANHFEGRRILRMKLPAHRKIGT